MWEKKNGYCEIKLKKIAGNLLHVNCMVLLCGRLPTVPVRKEAPKLDLSTKNLTISNPIPT